MSDESPKGSELPPAGLPEKPANTGAPTALPPGNNGNGGLPPINLAAETTADHATFDQELAGYAYTLTKIILTLMVVGGVGVWLLSFSFGTSLPPVPSPPGLPAASGALDSYKSLVDRYKDMADIQTTRFTSTFQLVVMSALLPTLTALFGYMFGKRSA